MADQFQQARGLLDRRNTVWMKRRNTLRRPLHDSDAELPRLGGDILDKRTVLGRRRIRVARHITSDRVEHGGSIANRPADDALDGEPVPGITDIRSERDPSARRLEPNQAALARRDPD